MSSANIALLASAILAVFMTSCASQPNAGNAGMSVSGTAKSQTDPKQRKEGEFYNTETMTPGVGSALFPDPAWR
jgi:hypothetical protein